jgi:hypothetical protein
VVPFVDTGRPGQEQPVTVWNPDYRSSFVVLSDTVLVDTNAILVVISDTILNDMSDTVVAGAIMVGTIQCCDA